MGKRNGGKGTQHATGCKQDGGTGVRGYGGTGGQAHQPRPPRVKEGGGRRPPHPNLWAHPPTHPHHYGHTHPTRHNAPDGVVGGHHQTPRQRHQGHRGHVVPGAEHAGHGAHGAPGQGHRVPLAHAAHGGARAVGEGHKGVPTEAPAVAVVEGRHGHGGTGRPGLGGWGCHRAPGAAPGWARSRRGRRVWDSTRGQGRLL